MPTAPVELKKTRGTCPACIKMVDARVIEKNGSVYIEKICPKHGVNSALLSNAPDYYRELMDFYFAMDGAKSRPQRDYILRLTAKCNLDCPICLASANDFTESDLTLADLKLKLAGRKKVKLDLMGAEPTLREDLVDVIRWAAEKGHITALHTNGIAIGDAQYLGRLKTAGLSEVHLQFDSFAEDHDVIIRGRSMAEEKNMAIDSLRRHGLSTDLVVTVLRGLNETETAKILDFAAGQEFVKEVFYLGCRLLGRASEGYKDRAYAPDELIDVLEKQTGGVIKRSDVKVFQKLYFSMLAAFNVRKCFYIHHYMVLRRKGGWRPVSDYIDLKFLEPRLEGVKRLFRKSKLLSTAYLGLSVLAAIVKKGGFSLIAEGVALSLILLFGFDLSKIRRRSLLLGFITACDPWIYDENISVNCGKGEISTDIGFFDSGADANVTREKKHLGVNLLNKE